jgi:hypothetical protein
VATLKTNNTALSGLTIILLIATLFFYFFPNAQTQTRQEFNPTNRYDIPQLNGSIRFAANGSYQSAILENNTWLFNDLRFNTSRPQGNLKVSAENSNITIFSYQSLNFIGRSEFLRVKVDGIGTQTVNLGLNTTRSTDPSEWSVVTPGSIFLAEGEGWKLQPDNTVIITSLTGNFSVFHYNLGINEDENLPFYQKHSIAIITAIVLTSTIAAATIINFRGRK